MGRSLSSSVGEYFEYLVLARWVDHLAEEPGLGMLEFTSEVEVAKSRSTGLEASRVMKKIKEGRVEMVFYGGR